MRRFVIICLFALFVLPLAARSEQFQVRLTDLEQEYFSWSVSQQFSAHIPGGRPGIKPVSMRYKGHFRPAILEWTNTETGDVIGYAAPQSIRVNLEWWPASSSSAMIYNSNFDMTVPFDDSPSQVLPPFTVIGWFETSAVVGVWPYPYVNTDWLMPVVHLEEAYITFESTPAVPEPSGILTLLCGSGCVGWRAWSKRRQGPAAVRA